MTPLESRLFFRSIAIGIALTLVVLLAGAMGLLDSLEYWLYDLRAAHCQLAAIPPTTQFTHLDIDDASLEALGRWPWRRGILARILDEVQRAKPSAIGLDILFSEPQKTELISDPKGLHTVDDDAELAAVLRKSANAVLAASFRLESGEAQSAALIQAVPWFKTDLEMSLEEFQKRLIGAGLPPLDPPAIHDLFLTARRQAMKERIDAELDSGPATLDQLRPRLLPHSPEGDSPLTHLLADQFAATSASHGVYRFGAPLQTLTPPPAHGTLSVVPIPIFSRVAAGCAFTNYDIFDNASVRAVPLFVEFNNRLYPQMGLATACVMLGADPKAVRFEGSNVIIPAPGRTISIPTYVYHSKALGRDVPLIAAVPYFGGRDWETMYDWPAHRNAVAHLSIVNVWDICLAQNVIARNNANIDLAIDDLLNNQRPNQSGLDPDLAKKYSAQVLDPKDIDTRETRAANTLKKLKDAGWLDMYRQMAEKDMAPSDRIMRDNLIGATDALQKLLPENRKAMETIESQRQMLASAIRGKGILVGFTATGFEDQVSTALHLHCPGVVVHGVIVNAVLTGSWWRMAPPWVTVLLTILFGMGTALAKGWFSPTQASLLVLGLLVGYALVNGYVLFDWQKLIVGLASPSVAVITIWAACTLNRVIVEGIERNRIAVEVAVFSKEMELARNVQVALIPTQAPNVEGFEAEGWALAASITGGDCYDLWQMADGRLAILLADASGHGLAPAMIVSQVRTLVRALSESESQSNPYNLLSRVNNRLASDLEANRFVTAFLGFLSRDGVLDWASAGHGPMYWCPDSKGEMQELDSTSLPLGIMPDWENDVPLTPLQLHGGGILAVFSDGLFEAPDPKGGQFSVERVKEILSTSCTLPCVQIIAELRTAVQKWQTKTEPVDDQTVVIVRRISADKT